MATIAQVAAIRSQLWDAGFRPVPVLTDDKAPAGRDWPNRARQDPPECLRFDPVPHACNTGILCDGLRAIDIDVDDATVANRCRAVIVHRFGEAPIRTRRNSPRCLVLYRAASGTPAKTVLAGKLGKIEVLGKGQQFVAFGRHPSGADLEWFPEPPGQETVDALVAVSEDDLFALFADLAPLIEADPPKRTNGHDHHAGEPQADPLRIAAAFNAIPNGGAPDWEAWNRIAMAAWRATGGSEFGLACFDAWSARHPSYSGDLVNERWKHFGTSPPTQIGAGTLFKLAFDAERHPPPPDDPFDDPAYQAALGADTATNTSSKQELLRSVTDVWNPAMIALRNWVARGYLMRGAVTVISGPSSAGKSSLMVAWAASLALGSAFHRMKPLGECNVAFYNVEDDQDEQKRRFSAILQKLELTPANFCGRLAILGPAKVGTLLTSGRDGAAVVSTPVMNALEKYLDIFKPDVIILDPFVELHAAEENDNTAIRSVMASFRSWAVDRNMAVVILHHSRKGNGDPGDPDTLRGASSIVGAARVVLTLNVMNEKEADLFRVPSEQRRNYFRLDGAKNNYAPVEEAEWFQRQEIELPNGGDGAPGDRVAIAWPWRPTKPLDRQTPSDLNRVLDLIAVGPGQGIRYSRTKAGGDRWVGNLLRAELELASDAEAANMVGAWFKSGLLMVEPYFDAVQRKELPGVVVNPERRPT